MTRPIRVVVADDHAIVRAGLRALVEAQPGLTVAGEAGDGDEAWRMSCDLHPDVLLLDLSMPGTGGLDGAEAAERVARDCPDVRILVLTMHEERSYVSRLFALGASGYLLKRTAAQELVRAIHAVAVGERYLDAALAGGLSDGAEVPNGRGAPDGRRAPGGDGGTSAAGRADAVDAMAALTEREAEVLRRIARGQSNAEIAAALGIDVAEVQSRKGEAMRKLGLGTRAAIVRFATERGWFTTMQSRG